MTRHEAQEIVERHMRKMPPPPQGYPRVLPWVIDAMLEVADKQIVACKCRVCGNITTTGAPD